MKTLTEFSTLTLRKAAAARAAAGGSRISAPVAPVEPTSDAPAEVPEAMPAGDVEASAESAPDPAAESGAAPAEAAPAAPADPAVEAVAAALSVPADRAARLLEALDIVGGALDQVRLVRVYQGETGPHGSVSRGEFHYAIDRVAGQQRRGRDERGGDRGGRGGGDRGGRGGGGGGGMGGPGGDRRDKPRGLGSLKVGAKVEKSDDDDRPARGETPRAGIGWQLTAAPRDFTKEGRGPGRGGPRPPGRGRGPGGPGGDRGGPRGPGGPGGGRGPGGGPGGGRGPRAFGGGGGYGGGGGGSYGGEQRLGPDGQPLPRPPRPPRPPREQRLGPDGQPLPPTPRLGPDGQPLPPRPRRERKPIGPDAAGLGPDGTPWDPARRAQRMAERAAPNREMNAQQGGSVEQPPPSSAPADAQKE